MNLRTSASGRLAAWAALVAAVAAILALGVLLFQDFLALVLVLLAIALAGLFGWIALTRHGWVRAVALILAVIALIAGVVVLIRRGAIDELLVLAATLAVFGFFARTAIGQSMSGARTSRQTPVTSDRTRARTRRAVLLMNPKSGDGKPEKFHLADEAKHRGIEPILLGPGQDWRAVAQEAARTATIIGMAGGDGSQALVAQIAMEAEIPYVCIPAGTRNHLALDLGLDRDDIVGALDAFSSDTEYCVDLAFVNDRIFVNNVSLGIYAEIVQSDAYRGAKLETMENMLPDLLGPDSTPFDLQYTGPDGELHRSAQLILVSNNPYRLDKLAGMGSRPRLDTGELGMVALTIANAARAAEFLSLESVGQVGRFPGWVEWSASNFQVDSGAPVATGIDGEGVVLDPPLRFRIVPEALHVRLPPTAGLSPAALKPGLSTSGVQELWSIATGRR